MPFTQHFSAGSKYLGEVIRTSYFRQGEIMEPASYAFLCTYCGEVWARATVLNSNGQTTRWLAAHRPCPDCRDKSRYPISEQCGCILISYEPEVKNNAPYDLLVWEFLQLCHNKDQQCKSSTL